MSSEYEQNVGKLLSEKKRLLQSLESTNKDLYQINALKIEIESLESLFENYNLGMNVFRRSRGGRNGLRE